MEGKTFTEQTRKPKAQVGKYPFKTSSKVRITTDTVPREHPDWLEGHPTSMVARSLCPLHGVQGQSSL